MKNSLACLMGLLFLFAPSAAKAEDISHLSFGLGAYDVFGEDDHAIDFRAEYRPGVEFLVGGLGPWGGLEITSDLTTWVGGGLVYEIPVTEYVYLLPAAGVGLYSEGDSDADLGDSVQYRFQLEAAHKLGNGHGVSAVLSAMTDFDSDSGDEDSAETLGVYWHVPFNSIFQTDN